jgi:hypothetical protein
VGTTLGATTSGAAGFRPLGLAAGDGDGGAGEGEGEGEATGDGEGAWDGEAAGDGATDGEGVGATGDGNGIGGLARAVTPQSPGAVARAESNGWRVWWLKERASRATKMTTAAAIKVQ